MARDVIPVKIASTLSCQNALNIQLVLEAVRTSSATRQSSFMLLGICGRAVAVQPARMFERGDAFGPCGGRFQ